MKINNVLILILMLFVGTSIVGEVILTEKEAEELYERLDKDEHIIKWQAKRWNGLVNTNPKITYKIVDGNVIIQTVEFPIKNDKPLIYEVKMKITQKDEPRMLFPFTLSLCGILESGVMSRVDAKLGVQLFNFPSVGLRYFKSLGIHCLIGAQSSGVSLSWRVTDYLKNTRIHLYSGMTYEMKKSFGIGVSLNF